MQSALIFLTLPDLTVAADNVFIGVEFLKPHRAAGMELLCGDAHFTAEAEFTAVGKAGGAVDVDSRGIH